MGKTLKHALAVFVSLATMLTLSVGAAATAGAATGGSASPTEAATSAPTTVPVSGQLADGTGAVDGTLDVKRFDVVNGTMKAFGTFTGEITNADGQVVKSGTQQVAVPVDLAASNGSCQILDLVLGPLDLDLLGLQVHLDTVHLNITAEQGPGNLLGNLLCAVAGLLDGTGLGSLLDQLAALLNELLGALGA